MSSFMNISQILDCKFKFRGIPNSLIRLFLIKLFKLNPKTAIGCYVNAISAVSPLPDIRVLQPGSEPYFGRKDLTNTYLTTTGSFMCRRLLYTLKLNYPSISVYCLMFPRVIQLLL